MDIRKIKKLINLVEESSISTLEISEGKKTIRIMRSESKISPSSFSFPTQKELNTFKYIHNKQEKHTTSNTKNDVYTVYSPMIGIFYRSSNPNNTPFISIGQSVKIGDTLCIIEAMKVMNQIQSEKSGIVQKILIENGKPVEFGEPLLIIKITQE